jgi:hypothetical protein
MNNAHYLYHGTTVKGMAQIVADGYLATEYFGEKAIYLTAFMERAEMFGSYIFMLPVEGINPDNLHTDDVNDGIYHAGALALPKGTKIRVLGNSEVEYDMTNLLLEKVGHKPMERIDYILMLRKGKKKKSPKEILIELTNL